MLLVNVSKGSLLIQGAFISYIRVGKNSFFGWAYMHNSIKPAETCNY